MNELLAVDTGTLDTTTIEVDATRTVDPGFRLIRWDNVEAHVRLSSHLADPRVAETFWTDNMRVDPAAWYLTMFANPFNLVVEMYDETVADKPSSGVILFSSMVPGWRGTMSGISWGRGSTWKKTKWQLAIAGIMSYARLETVDAITAVTNRAARFGLKRLNFRQRAVFPNYYAYNGLGVDGVWYELDRTVPWVASALGGS